MTQLGEHSPQKSEILPTSIIKFPASSSILTRIPIKREAISIENSFNGTPLLSITSLDSHISQKIAYHIIPNPLCGLFGEYLTCPTIGDGNCFFHAVFTEPGDTCEMVTLKATTLRANFYNIIQTNDDYAKIFAFLVYEYYRGLWGTRESDNIPDLIKTLFQKDDEYVAARNTLIELGVNPLPIHLSSPQKHPAEYITSQISLDNIRSYMERFRVVGSAQTHIPFRNGVFCPAEALVILGQKRVNIFTYNEKTHQLFLYKPATSPQSIKNIDISNYPIVNILHTGNHYVRLFNPLEGNMCQIQCQQIIHNFES